MISPGSSQTHAAVEWFALFYDASHSQAIGLGPFSNVILRTLSHQVKERYGN